MLTYDPCEDEQMEEIGKNSTLWYFFLCNLKLKYILIHKRFIHNKPLGNNVLK
jgi:hypothetical protein